MQTGIDTQQVETVEGVKVLYEAVTQYGTLAEDEAGWHIQSEEQCKVAYAITYSRLGRYFVQ